jgi:Bax protein
MNRVATLYKSLAWRAGPKYQALAIVALIFLGGIFPAYLGIELTRGIMSPGPRSVGDVLMDFDLQGFDLEAVLQEQRTVPRIYLPALPRDWRKLANTTERKRAFTMIVLPLVLYANEILLEERDRLRALAARIDAKAPLPERDRTWILALAELYKVDAPEATREAVSALRQRIDIVPPSLAIAQAAIESGWGTSRFTTEGNALFGQWSEDKDDSMIPARRDAGRTYAIKRFSTLLGSIKAYMRNLNSHRAYRKFRAARARSRAAGEEIAGLPLAKLLGSYSQQGPEYVRALTSIIEKNQFANLDRAVLRL